jgi:vancomycin resistance protein YoaR
MGYRKAATFVGDEVLDDYGGGVCQISTTVYMAMLNAGFSIYERHCHSMPVSTFRWLRRHRFHMIIWIFK